MTDSAELLLFCTMSKQIVSRANTSQFLCSQWREIVIPAWLIWPILDFYCRTSCALSSINYINKTALQSEDYCFQYLWLSFFGVLVISRCLSERSPVHLNFLSGRFSVISVLYLRHSMVVHIISVCLQDPDTTLPIFCHLLPASRILTIVML